jgi:dUTP pyrophosphatase
MYKFTIKKLSKTARIPTKGSSGAAAYDLYADNENPIIITPGEVLAIPTNIAIDLTSTDPNKLFYGRIAERSGLGLKNSISVRGGVIDADFRGGIAVILQNLKLDTNTSFVVKPGDRIAQLIIYSIPTTELIEADELSNTERGVSGFGSTGIGNLEKPL